MTSCKRQATDMPASPPAKRPHLNVSKTDDDNASEREEAQDAILRRIQSGIRYTREQRAKGEAIRQTTRFELAIGSRNTAAHLLRLYATQIYISPSHAVFELGIPRPDWVTAGIVPGQHDPQWWVGLTTAEVKAGPYAEKSDIARAAATLKAANTRRRNRTGPTVREKQIERKLSEGLRLQQLESESESEEELIQSAEESDDSEDGLPIKRGLRTETSRDRPNLYVIVEEEEEEEDSGSEEDVPLLNDVRYILFKTSSPQPNSELSDSEEEIPLLKDARYIRFREGRLEQKAAGSDNEEDIPLSKDPRYIQFKLRLMMQSR